MRYALLWFVLWWLPVVAVAAETPAKSDTAPPTKAETPAPKPTGGAEPETGLQPEIIITTRGTTTFEEHRLNGRVYMVKVTPKNGKPYYLYDREGNGQFNRSELEPKLAIPTWVIKRW